MLLTFEELSKQSKIEDWSEESFAHICLLDKLHVMRKTMMPMGTVSLDRQIEVHSTIGLKKPIRRDDLSKLANSVDEVEMAADYYRKLGFNVKLTEVYDLDICGNTPQKVEVIISWG